MNHSIKVGRYLGIDVYLHYSWFFIFALLAWALATGFFPQQFPGYSEAEYGVLGLVSSLLLFVSVLLHELSHSVVARRNGMKVDRITLFFFGGLAGLHEQKFTPKTEFRMSIAGPMMSLVISMVFLIVYNTVEFFYVSAIAAYLYRINMILAIFNLVPGFPLDGGRVLRSIVWYWTKDFKKATRIATMGGKIFAYVLIFLGLGSIFSGAYGGLWFILIGFFLLLLSTLSYQQVEIKDALAGRKVKQFLIKRFAVFDADMSLKQALAKYFLSDAQEAYPVVKDGKFAGMIMFKDVQSINKRDWMRLRIHEVMMPARKAGRVRLNTGAYTALAMMLKKGLPLMPVFEKKRMVGLVTRDSILRYVKMKEKKEKLEKMGFKVE
ncbi:TPA: CBS domain-containing protein [Candidatus Woesearchaeota archaeon]|nr:CBS domain-containing protein [Candidatus Woesearchaeota archaeon]